MSFGALSPLDGCWCDDRAKAVCNEECGRIKRIPELEAEVDRLRRIEAAAREVLRSCRPAPSRPTTTAAAFRKHTTWTALERALEASTDA